MTPRRIRLARAAVVALAAATSLAVAAPQAQPPAAPWRESSRMDSTRFSPAAPTRIPQQPPQTPPPAPPPPASPVIARVDGRGVTQADFDRIAVPYYQTLRAQLGSGFNDNIQRVAAFNVIDELIRREVLAVEAQRKKIEVSPAEIDSVLRQDPLFLTDGKFDPAKFDRYKTDPNSNYQQILPNVRQVAAIRKLDESLRRRFKPIPAQVRAEWSLRNDQVRLSMLSLTGRDMSLEPEATAAEMTRYYGAHPDEFMQAPRVRLRYARLPLPLPADAARAAEEPKALKRASAIADSLRAGTLADTGARLMDSGLFDLPTRSVPGLSGVPGLVEPINRVEEDSTVRIVGPVMGTDAVVVGAVVERRPRQVAPLREVLAEVKRRADAEKQRIANESERRAYYEAHRDHWRRRRGSVTRVTLNGATLAVPAPTAKEVERWYAERGHSLFGRPNDSKAWLPPLTDSLRSQTAARISEERRSQRAAEILKGVADGDRFVLDPRGTAWAQGARAETLWVMAGSNQDTIFEGPLVDSLLAPAGTARGKVQGPRPFGDYSAVWRLDSVDTSYVQPYSAVGSQSDREFEEERARRDEAEARAYFEQHRDDYKTPVRYALDFVAVRIPFPDSVSISEREIRRHYDANAARYAREEQVRARHILFMTRDAGPEVEQQAKKRADSLLAAIRKDGGDFAELAKRFSQEPGAAVTGGDLGWFGRGRMVKEFEQAAFALDSGEVSPVVKTAFGYHIIKLEGRKAAGTKPFDEVRSEIRRLLAAARGDSTASHAANALARALASGGDAKTLAARYGGVVSPDPSTPIENAPQLRSLQALELDLPKMPVGKWSQKVYPTPDDYIVVRVRQRIAPQPAEFDDVKGRALEDVRSAQRDSILKVEVKALRAALAGGMSLDSAAFVHGGLRDSGHIRQSQRFLAYLGFEPRVVDRAFTLKPGDVTDTLQVSQGVVWLRLDERKPADEAGFAEAAPQIEADLLKKKYDEWVAEKKKTVSVEILRSDLKGPRPAS
jgi:parvulin-like peptidyl-prolyl isomerase